jgi:hypothetical protein
MGRYNVREPYPRLIPIKPHQEKKENKRKSKPINGKVAWILIDIIRENRKQAVKIPLTKATVNQHTPVHHPLDACYDLVVDDPQLSYYPVSSW